MSVDLDHTRMQANIAELHYVIMVAPNGNTAKAAIAFPDDIPPEIAAIYLRELLAAVRK